MIIICGLPGTGKTTLCKKIETNLNYQYISDWDIFEQNNVVINRLENKLFISQKYSSLILDFIKTHSKKNLVLDLEYSITPEDFVSSEISKLAQIYYLGFISVDEKSLFSLFKNSSESSNLNNDELMTKIEYLKNMSNIYYKQCMAFNIDFIDINKDKKIIIDEILNQIKTLIKKGKQN